MPDPASTATAIAPPRSRSGRRLWLIGAVTVIALVALFTLGREAATLLPRLAASVRDAGAWAPLLFIALYALACVAFVPASLLTLAAGAIFGLWTGIGLVATGATLGAASSFLIARYVARRRVERWLVRDARLATLDTAVARDGRRIMFLLRLSPAFPFTAMNYALGLTRVRFADFLVAMIGILPGTTLYVYAGRVAGVAASAAGGSAAPRGAAYYTVLGLGLAATLAVTVIITRIARRALSRSPGYHSD